MESKQNLLARGMRRAGRIIGMVAAGFFLVILVGEAIGEATGEGGEIITDAGILLAALSAVALVGCILSFWRERLAGILLVLVSIGLGIHIGIYAGHNHFLAWSMVGLPYLVAGGLILYSYWLERKAV
jgi:hypothetical protein